jgi:hypothetical protein
MNEYPVVVHKYVQNPQYRNTNPEIPPRPKRSVSQLDKTIKDTETKINALKTKIRELTKQRDLREAIDAGMNLYEICYETVDHHNGDLDDNWEWVMASDADSIKTQYGRKTETKLIHEYSTLKRVLKRV